MEIWMDVDAALSEVPVNLMPLLDDTDFKTRETAVAYNASGMDLVWNFVTTAGAYTQTAVTPTTSGTYDWTHQGDGMYSIEIPASGGASINNDTEGFGWFTGVATGVLPWRGPVIGFRAAGLNDLLIDSAYSATRGLAGTALPNAAADAAGGLPISDAGGLDLDARLDAAITSRLAPTTAGRTLDVSATGEAGLDFDNVKQATGATTLTNITVPTVTTAGSVSGAVGSVTGNVGGNVTGSVGSVVGAVGSVTGAVGSVTGNVGGNVVGSVGSVTSGVTVSTNNDKTGYGLADGALSAAKFASDYFTAIITAVWTTAASRTLTAFGFSVTASNVTDKTGYSLAADQAVNVTKVGGTTVSGPDDLKATGFSTHSAADVKAAMEATGSMLERLDNTLVSDGVFSTASLANAPAGGGGGGDATAANQALILAAIGTPTDTDLATDIANLQADVTALSPAVLTGPYTLQFTITNASGGAALQNARIRVYLDDANSETKLTNVSGQLATPFSVTGATRYYYTIAKDGFSSASGYVDIGSTNETVEEELTAISIDPPASATKITGYKTFPASGLSVTIQLTQGGGLTYGDEADQTDTTDADGYVQFQHTRGAYYRYKVGTGGWSREYLAPTTGDSFEIG